MVEKSPETAFGGFFGACLLVCGLLVFASLKAAAFWSGNLGIFCLSEGVKRRAKPCSEAIALKTEALLSVG